MAGNFKELQARMDPAAVADNKRRAQEVLLQMGLPDLSSARQHTQSETAAMNAAIATNVFGWSHIAGGLYTRPGSGGGSAELCPDFRINPHHERLCKKMEGRGFKLAVSEHPWSLEHNEGKIFTARLTRGSETFEATNADQNIAMCLAVLDAVHCPVAA
jgi:hypothetical protein